MAKLVLKKERCKKDLSYTSSPLSSATQELATDHQARIAARAFELYERRGRTHGSDVQDWLQAEKELYGFNVGRR